MVDHRRRMEREAKAKVVASVWGAKFVQFLAALAVLPRSIWKNKGCGKELNNFAPQTDATTFALFSIIPSFFYG